MRQAVRAFDVDLGSLRGFGYRGEGWSCQLLAGLKWCRPVLAPYNH